MIFVSILTHLSNVHLLPVPCMSLHLSFLNLLDNSFILCECRPLCLHCQTRPLSLQQLQYIHACFYRACELLTSFPSINSSLNPTNTMFMPTNYSTPTQILYKMKTFSSLPVVPRTKYYIFFVCLNNKIKPSLPVC